MRENTKMRHSRQFGLINENVEYVANSHFILIFIGIKTKISHFANISTFILYHI